MLESIDIELSKNPVTTGEKFVIAVEVADLFENAKRYRGKYGYRYVGVKNSDASAYPKRYPKKY